MIVSDLLTEERILPDLTAGSKAEALTELSALMEDSVPEVDGPGILAVIQEREDVSSTAIGNGVALPEDSAAQHLKALAGLSRLLADDAFRRVLLEAPGDELLGLIRERDGEA